MESVDGSQMYVLLKSSVSCKQSEDCVVLGCASPAERWNLFHDLGPPGKQTGVGTCERMVTKAIHLAVARSGAARAPGSESGAGVSGRWRCP